MEQLSLNWNAGEAERRKERGRNLAAAVKEPLLIRARELAVQIAERKGTVHMDAVVFAMECEGYPQGCLGNSAGSVFVGMEWTGQFTKSARPQSHRNLLRIWKLK